ncbi:hypothetical protein ABVT39_022939 [Epinephelus coioides]
MNRQQRLRALADIFQQLVNRRSATQNDNGGGPSNSGTTLVDRQLDFGAARAGLGSARFIFLPPSTGAERDDHRTLRRLGALWSDSLDGTDREPEPTGSSDRAAARSRTSARLYGHFRAERPRRDTERSEAAEPGGGGLLAAAAAAAGGGLTQRHVPGPEWLTDRYLTETNWLDDV